MKKIVLTILAAAAVLAGCKKTPLESEGKGTLAMSLSSDNKGYSDVVTGPGSKAGETVDIDVNTFKVKLERKEGGYSQTWDSYGDMPTILELQAGTYTVSAESSGEDKVAWDNAIYGGTKDFSIVVGSVSNVELICSLTNMKVSVKCSDNFLSELSDFEITVSNEFGNLTWERGDIERSGYFPVAPLEVRVKGYRAIDNSVAYSSIQINEVAARDHHILNLDAVTTGELNTSDSFITIDPGLNDREENVDVPGFDETPVPGGGEDPEPEEPAIVVEWPANPDFAPMEITQDMDVDLTIKAPAGIKTFVVNIESEALAQLGITKLDLVNPGDFKDIADMILEGQSLEDATEVSLKLSGLVPLLGATPGNHTFNLVMSDNDGNTLEKTAVFYVSE